MSEPDRRAASTTTMPSEKPEIEAIAARKVVGARLPGEWHFRYRGALRQNLFKQCDMFGRIDPVVAAGEHGHSAGAQARAMCGGVDAASESGHNGKARIAQIPRNALGKLDPRCRRSPRADNADQRAR